MSGATLNQAPGRAVSVTEAHASGCFKNEGTECFVAECGQVAAKIGSRCTTTDKAEAMRLGRALLAALLTGDAQFVQWSAQWSGGTTTANARPTVAQVLD